MSEIKKFTCINCPMGCSVTVTAGEGGLLVEGNECRRGEEYSLQEYSDPRRVLTGTVKVEGGFLPRLPVKTAGPLPLDSINEAARALAGLTARAPVRCGDIIAADLAGSGIALVATRDLEVGID